MTNYRRNKLITEWRTFQNVDWPYFKNSEEYKRLKHELESNNIKHPYSENIIHRIFYSGYFNVPFLENSAYGKKPQPKRQSTVRFKLKRGYEELQRLNIPCRVSTLFLTIVPGGRYDLWSKRKGVVLYETKDGERYRVKFHDMERPVYLKKEYIELIQEK
jgi:hypothetical protein